MKTKLGATSDNNVKTIDFSAKHVCTFVCNKYYGKKEKKKKHHPLGAISDNNGKTFVYIRALSNS